MIEQKLYNIKFLELGIFHNSKASEYFYTDKNSAAITLSEAEAKEFVDNFLRLEQQATKTSKANSENLLAGIGIRKTENSGYINRSGEKITPPQLLQTLKSLIETDKLLEGINFYHTTDTILKTPEMSGAHSKHLVEYDAAKKETIANITKFIAGLGGASASWENNNCCDMNNLTITNNGNQEHAVLFQNGRTSIGISNEGKAFKGATVNINFSW